MVSEWYAISETGWRCRKYGSFAVDEDGVRPKEAIRYQLYAPNGMMTGPAHASFAEARQWLESHS